MNERMHLKLRAAVVLLSLVLLSGCGGGGGVDYPSTEEATVTGLKVFISDSDCPYAVYGGTFKPALLPGDCFVPDYKDVRTWSAIGDDPQGFECVLLGDASGTAEFQGRGYEYYVIKPLGDGLVRIDALQLMGVNVNWWGLWESRTGAQGFYSANVSDLENMYGPANGRAAKLTLMLEGQPSDPSGFIVLPAHSWIEGYWSG